MIYTYVTKILVEESQEYVTVIRVYRKHISHEPGGNMDGDNDLATYICVWFLFGIIVIIAAFDLVIIHWFPKNKSISLVILEISTRYPIIPFLLGALLGHLFWPHQHPRE